ncbi:hypothetical protein EDD21DRAFT_230447 [Dissophora ornata]|nr:hypothetical protein EDD21DRAFT_230447 [Dissophora ornata]
MSVSLLSLSLFLTTHTAQAVFSSFSPFSLLSSFPLSSLLSVSRFVLPLLSLPSRPDWTQFYSDSLPYLLELTKQRERCSTPLMFLCRRR